MMTCYQELWGRFDGLSKFNRKLNRTARGDVFPQRILP